MLKPRKGESKQAFFKRAVDALKKDGKSDAAAMAEAAKLWNEHSLSACVKDFRLNSDAEPVHHTYVPLELADTDSSPEPDGPARFSILAHTGKIIDFGWYRFVVSLKGISCKSAFPCFREHNRLKIVGHHDDWKVDKNGFYCFGQFSQSTPDGIEVLALARENFPWQASVGIRPTELRFLERGQSAKVNGRKVEGPLEIWEASIISENSICALGADDDTAAIVMSRDNIQPEDTMKYSKHLKLALGLSADATDAQVEAALEKLNVTLADGATAEEQLASLVEQLSANGGGDELPDAAGTPQQLGSPAPASAPASTGLGAEVEQQVAAEVQKQMLALEERSTKVLELCMTLGLSKDWGMEQLKSPDSVEAICLRAVKEAHKNQPAFGAQALSFGDDESDKFRQLAAEGFAVRLGLGDPTKLSDGARPFAGFTCMDMVDLCLQRAGVSTVGMSHSQRAQKLLSSQVMLAASVSDFKSVFMDVANIRLLNGYNEAPATWEIFTHITNANDFKEIHGVALSEAPNFELIHENGEYKTGELKDRQESYHVAKYGKRISLSWEMLVNDNLRAFLRLAQLFGAACRRKQADIVYDLLLSNKNMKDGKPLFHSTRGNIGTGAAISSDSLSEARKIMRRKKGMNGALIDVQPRFLLVPTALETQAEVLLHSMAAPEGAHSGVANVWKSSFTPVSDPRLDEKSETAWYLLADQNQVDTIEMAYLDGQREPEITEKESFDTDAIHYKARLVCGAGIMDHVGFFQNPGA